MPEQSRPLPHGRGSFGNSQPQSLGGSTPTDVIDARPGAVAVRGGRIVASGRTEEVEKLAAGFGPVRHVDLPDRLLIPALVNAHAHLDLTDIGPVPYEGDFIRWIEMVIARRPRTDEAITAAVRRALQMSREAGVGWIGDIAGSETAARARIDVPDEFWVPGVSYLEVFGFGERGRQIAEETWNVATSLNRQAEHRSRLARARIADPSRSNTELTPPILLRLRNKLACWFNDKDWPSRSELFDSLRYELQPHAPYSAGLPTYAVAHNCCLGFPSTHLAETLAEDEFVRHATGPFADLLRRIGKWDDSIKPTGKSPIAWLRDELAMGTWTLAHCNYVDDEDIAILKKLADQITVAYCPLASEYFGHANHRYRDMLTAGINVALGTDSILCQPSSEQQPLGILPQMRRLYRRDLTDPGTLLRMGTINGLPLGWRLSIEATLQPGAAARLVAVRIDPDDPADPLTQALRNDEPATPIGAW